MLPSPRHAGRGNVGSGGNGFPNLDSPYNADLPYELEQIAIFGEGTYAITDALDVTIGARYYDFEESRQFISGGLFANGDRCFRYDCLRWLQPADPRRLRCRRCAR